VLLPTEVTPLRARGEVRWRHDAGSRNEHAASSFGVVFTGFEDDGRIRLARYLEALRCGWRWPTPTRTPGSCSRWRSPTWCSSSSDRRTRSWRRSSARGDVSALAICGDDEVQAMLLVQLAASVTEDNLTFEGKPRDLAARIVYCAQGEAVHIASLFNEKKLYRQVSRPLTDEALREAVMDACGEHAMRVEQERMAQELERNLQRERALRAGPVALPVEAGPGFQSARMQAVLEQVRMVAPYKVSVLLQGDTGTGKEVLSRIVHRMSDRRDGPFVVQDCGTLTETLLESELFGHVRGAFTGAVADHRASSCSPTGGRCSSTRSRTPRRRCRPSCSACSRRARCARWAARRRAGWTCAW